MKSILVELTCSTCLYHTYRKSETLLISDFETQAREELLNDTFFTLRCPRCGHLIEFLHPLAYVDKLHNFILLIKPEKEFQEKDHSLYAEDTISRKRFLSDHIKISEKLRILEDDLDDRAIELLKYRIKRHYIQQEYHEITIQYHDCDNHTQTIWFEINKDGVKEHIAIIKAEYERIETTLSREQANHYLKVDENWAENYFLTYKQ